ncbi:MAG: hypothetical protein J7497_13055, partial [Chitinophagaceae bacterium]|nr:hypothetical protein [Chitinophagaceae bacterium]
EKWLSKIAQKSNSIEHKLERQSERYLNKLAKQEARIKKQLYKKDSALAAQLFDGTDSIYRNFQTQTTRADASSAQYFPYLDSVKNVLQFVKNNSPASAIKSKIDAPLNQMKSIQGRLKSTEDIQKFIQERKQKIKEALAQYTKLPKGLANSYNAYKKEAYYYAAQINEYKDILNNPDKIERKALELLNKIPAFKDFMQKNSFLASLFGGSAPENFGTPAALANLQTSAQVQQLTSGRLSMGGSGAQADFQQNMQAAQSQITRLKDKINKLGGAGADVDMPDFQPNQQRRKSFLQRIELGGNIQTQKSNIFFPVTSDISVSLGYRINDKTVMGVGTGYKIGFGRDIRHIAFTSEGMNLRSFFDIKIKGSFWATGGAELNYRSRFDHFEELKNRNAWAPSALAGIAKKYRLSKKMKGEFKLMYDALWRRQVPQAQPVVFRVGYSMN